MPSFDWDLNELRQIHYREMVESAQVGDFISGEIAVIGGWQSDVIKIALFPEIPVTAERTPEVTPSVEIRVFERTRRPTALGVVRAWRRIQ